MSALFTLCLAMVGLINFLPVLGVLGVSKLEAAYAISLPSSDLVILMQHRALLFGLLGGYVFYSLFSPQHQTAAMTLAGISMVGFAVFVHLTGTDNQAITKVLFADYAGLVFLAAAVFFKFKLNIA